MSDTPTNSAPEAPRAASDDTGPSPQKDAADNTTTPRAVRKVREGVVVSDSMDKTVVVAIIERVRHPKYNKFVLQTKRLYAHDETNDVNVGDKVRVMETRPLSKTKRWRIAEILERAK
jgi:small subunit ribosomal protein S17